MIDPRAMHSSNHAQYGRWDEAKDMVSSDYLKSRAHAQDREKHKAWAAQVKAAKVKKPAEETPTAPSSPAPSQSSPSKPSPGRKLTSAAPRQDHPADFGRVAGSYSKTPGATNLGGFDRPNIFAGKGTAQPDVSKAAVSRNVPPKPNPWAGKATISVTPTHKPSSPASAPAPSAPSAPAAQGWAARAGQSLVNKASSIEQRRNGSGRRSGFAGGSSSHLGG